MKPRGCQLSQKPHRNDGVTGYHYGKQRERNIMQNRRCELTILIYILCPTPTSDEGVKVAAASAKRNTF